MILTSQARSNTPSEVKVLLISSLPEVQHSLRHILDHSNWLLHWVSTCRGAFDYLSENDTVVVICERDLPDGDWKLVLNRLDSLPVPPNLIVTSRHASEELWAEVLNLGGYDVLAQPFETQEVYHVVILAWRERRRRLQRSAKRMSVPEAAQAKFGATT